MRSLILTAAIALGAPLAMAQTQPIMAYPPQNDTVSMSLLTEDWVQTQTARTERAVDASLPGSDAGKVRGDILTSVRSLAQGADWRFTVFDRNQDASGLEHWHAVVEARLPETQLGGLSDRAKQASKPGLQIKVQSVDFSPTLAEIEEVHRALRQGLVSRFSNGAVIPILYGGSVKPSNAVEILHAAEVGGALVGGASLKAEDFLPIIRAAG